MAHQHYKGTGKMHSFRGLLADGGQDKIRIQGATGEIAWKITKFELFPYNPGTAQSESTVSIYREEQSSVPTATATVDFDNDELLAAAFYSKSASVSEAISLVTVFDNALFVRNIYVSHTEVGSVHPVNYYIELEEVKVSAAGMAQLSVAAARRTIA